MQRAVLDANVIASGILIAQGHPAKILDAWRNGRFALVISEAILSDVKSTLNEKRLRSKYPGLTKARIGRLINLLRQYSIVTPGNLYLRAIERDPDDDEVIAAAVEGKAEFLVSGDDHLLRLGAYRGIQIVTPAEFVTLLDR